MFFTLSVCSTKSLAISLQVGLCCSNLFYFTASFLLLARRLIGDVAAAISSPFLGPYYLKLLVSMCHGGTMSERECISSAIDSARKVGLPCRKSFSYFKKWCHDNRNRTLWTLCKFVTRRMFRKSFCFTVACLCCILGPSMLLCRSFWEEQGALGLFVFCCNVGQHSHINGCTASSWSSLCMRFMFNWHVATFDE